MIGQFVTGSELFSLIPEFLYLYSEFYLNFLKMFRFVFLSPSADLQGVWLLPH